MDKPYNIFISWSGGRSHSAAEFLHKWLPKVIQTAKPWLSSEDIEKGSRSQDEIAKVLKGSRFGIICLTPENRDRPWVLFEAGALSKTFDDRTRVCTYLLGGLEPQDVTQPLGLFQATRAEKEDTRKLLHTINAAVSDEPLPEENLNELFDAMWPKLEEALSKLPPAGEAAPAKRKMEDMMAEVLEITRAEANRRDREALSDSLRSLQEAIMAKVAGVSVTPMYSPAYNRRATVARSLLGGIPAPPPTPTADLGGMPAPQALNQGPTPPPVPSALNGVPNPAPPPTPKSDAKAK
jgi:hypothetical protein